MSTAVFDVGSQFDRIDDGNQLYLFDCMTTNDRVTIRDDTAELWAHGYAWNRVAALPAGSDLWDTWGNID